MKKILQVNVVVNTGSTGRIAEDIGSMAILKGWKSYIAFGRNSNFSQSELIKIGNKAEIFNHVALTRAFDAHGLGSSNGTLKFIQEIEKIKPDIIHLHNIHGYYLNLKILFSFLSRSNIPVVWTLHDCWSFTGHCIYYSFVDCNKWQTSIGCNSCPQKRTYPQSLFYDRSHENFFLKKRLTSSIKDLTLVPVSKWLQKEVEKSFLKVHNIKTIYNGIDIEKFSPKDYSLIQKKYSLEGKFVILGVAGDWSERKGLKDFLALNKLLRRDQLIILIGLTKNQKKNLPKNIIGVERTESLIELAMFYSRANVFINPTWEDNYPTTNLEAMACGTPVITYKTGGSPEALEKNTGFVVPQGDLEQLQEKIQIIQKSGTEKFSNTCRSIAEEKFNKNDCFEEYFLLYEELLKKKNIINLGDSPS